VRPLPDAFAVALVLAPAGANAAVARLGLTLEPAAPTALAHAGLEALRAAIPAARSLPLLEAVARRATTTVAIDFQPALALRVALAPGPRE
jgi:hypothetical protein